MLTLARLSIARPRITLTLAVAGAIALSVLGLNIESSLSPSTTAPAGTEAAHAAHLVRSEFGPTQLVPVLLTGPKAQLDRQGPALAATMAKQRDIRVMTPWDGGPLARRLRPKPDAAMIIASVARTDKQMFSSRQEQVEHLVRTSVSPPVTSYVSGTPALQRGLVDESLHITRVGLAWSLPILLVLLLLLLRAPVAALLITAFGIGTALAGLGAMALVGKVGEVSPLAVPYGALTGLAVGAGYALLLYGRWSEQVAGGASVRDAALTAVGTAGRAVLIGGTVLVMAMLIAAIVGVTDVLVSEGSGAVICGLLGIGSAAVVMPAALVTLGPRMGWLSFPAPRFATAAWDRLVGAEDVVVRRAAYAGAAATALLVVVVIPASKLVYGPPDPLRLPAANEDRIAYEQIGKVMRPGWTSPYNMVLVSKGKPITDPALIAQVSHLQSSVAADKRVVVVAGPGSLASTSRQLEVLPKKLQQSQKLLKKGPKDLGRLQAGLAQAGAGSVKLRSGLEQAAAGAGQIHTGSGSAQSGAGQLHAGLTKAHAGSATITAGLNQALAGANQLSTGAAAALAGSTKISGGLGQALKPVQQGVPVVQDMASSIASSNDAVTSAQAGNANTISGLDSALSQLQGVSGAGAATASVQQARSSAAGVSNTLNGAAQSLGGATTVSAAFAQQVAQLSTGLSQLYNGSTALESGLAQLRSGNASLAAGIHKLAAGGGTLTTGLTSLRDGAGQLETGLGQLTTGSGTLAGSLAGGVAPVRTLTNGLETMRNGVATFRRQLPSPKDLARLQKQSPGLFDNGYFVLAAVEGAPPAARNQASFAVNLDHGGTAGQILVVPTTSGGTKTNEALGNDLRDTGRRFASQTGTEVALGGQAGEFGDFVTAGSGKFWPVVGVITVATLILLAMMLRAVLLPLVVVAGSLLATASAFGVLGFLYSGSDPIIGVPGHGSFTPETLMGVFAFTFGLATIFPVLLLQRTREDFLTTHDDRAALHRALRGTAAAGTAAAVAMSVVTLPFVVTDFLSVQQFAVAALAGIVFSGLVVRPVLLPAAMALLGRKGWWPTQVAPPGPEAPTIPILRRARPAP